MRVFELERLEDVSGISGTGIVAQGVEFDNGKVCIAWGLPPKPSGPHVHEFPRMKRTFPSVIVYDSIEAVEAIHGHDGKTQIIYGSVAPP